MKYWNMLKSFLLEEANQKKVNRYFCISFFILLAINFFEKLIQTLPEAPIYLFTSDAFEVLLTGISAYLFYYYVKPKEHLGFKLLSVLGLLCLYVALGFLKTYRRGLVYEEHVYSEFTNYVVLTFLFLSLFYFFDNLNLFINNSYEKTKEALREAEQQILRQQFNPHFLYNAFNSLYSMSLQNHPNTSDSILKLSGMMRYLTDDVHVSGSQLKHEFKFIKDYLALERIRFGEKANISFEIQGEVDGLLIEPLLLIGLVENAFKHGFYTNNNNAFVNVIAEVADKDLRFTVRNSVFKKQHFQKTNRAGKGLKSLRKRLELSYPNNADFQISEKENEYIARLSLKLK